MMYQGSDFSDFEKCARIPALSRKWDPEHWPVREAVKRALQGNIFGDPEQVADAFLYRAGAEGFTYPVDNNYELAKDYASWLDGALRILQEDMPTAATPLPRWSYLGDEFQVYGYCDGDHISLVRAVHVLGDRVSRWPELFSLALGEGPVTVTQFCLPAIAKGRLASPLSLAYRQPMTGGYRLAKLEGEPVKFGPNWKRIGRWELPEVSWTEWREGIDRDRCLPLIQETYTVAPLARHERNRLLNDIEHFTASMSKVTHPRKWEACENCIYRGVCHGNKQGFIRKSLQRSAVQREDETEDVLS